MVNISPETGTRIEIDFYENEDEFDSRWEDFDSIKIRYHLVSKDCHDSRTTFLVALDNPIRIRNLERELSYLDIGILSVDHRTYLRRRY